MFPQDGYVHISQLKIKILENLGQHAVTIAQYVA